MPYASISGGSLMKIELCSAAAALHEVDLGCRRIDMRALCVLCTCWAVRRSDMGGEASSLRRATMQRSPARLPWSGAFPLRYWSAASSPRSERSAWPDECAFSR